MVTYCCVNKCEITSYMNDSRFFRFPKCKITEEKWIKFAKRGDGWIPKPNTKMCSKHFMPHLLPNGRLKKNAIPSVPPEEIGYILEEMEDTKFTFTKPSSDEEGVEQNTNHQNPLETKDEMNDTVIGIKPEPEDVEEKEGLTRGGHIESVENTVLITKEEPEYPEVKQEAFEEERDPLSLEYSGTTLHVSVKKEDKTVSKAFSCDQCEYSATRKSNLKKHKLFKHEGVRYSCDQCDTFTNTQSHLNQHKKNKHEGTKYHCDLCEYKASNSCLLKRHKARMHEGIKYPCDQCDYSSSDIGNLRKHKENKHLGIIYPCDECDYSAGHLSILKLHKESKHVGIRYLCDQCEYSATQIGNLKQHKEYKHEGVRHQCDQCEYSALTISNLKQHQKNKHEGIRYQCNQCDYLATRSNHLKLHVERKH